MWQHPKLGSWLLRGWICQWDCHCPTKCCLTGIGLLQSRTCGICPKGNGSEYNKIHQKKRTKVNQVKQKKSEDRKRRKRAGKRRKRTDSENWGQNLAGNMPKRFQKVSCRFCNSSNLYIFQSWNFVESSNPSHSMSMKANTWNVQLWKKYSIPHRIHVWYIC